MLHVRIISREHITFGIEIYRFALSVIHAHHRVTFCYLDIENRFKVYLRLHVDNPRICFQHIDDRIDRYHKDLVIVGRITNAEHSVICLFIIHETVFAIPYDADVHIFKTIMEMFIYVVHRQRYQSCQSKYQQ